MADGVTNTLGLIKPEYDGSVDTWGPKLNENFDKIDAAIKSLRDRGSYHAAEFGTFMAAVTETAANSNAWTVYPVTEKFSDPQNIITLASNQFTPSVSAAIEWDVMFAIWQDDTSSYFPNSIQVFADFRLWNVTDNALVARSFRGSHSHTYSQSKYPNTTSSNNSGMQGSAHVHCIGGARLEKDKSYRFDFYHRKPGSATRWYHKFVENTPGLSDELTLRVKVWNLG